jgi:hypothetical protein
MSAISSYFASANVYQPVDRNSFAQSSEAVGGAKQAFAETGDETAPEDHRQNQDSSENPETPGAQEAAPASCSVTDGHILNVTA